MFVKFCRVKKACVGDVVVVVVIHFISTRVLFGGERERALDNMFEI